MVSVVFLSLAAVQAKDEHVKIGLIVDALPLKFQKILNLLTLLAGLILFSTIVVVTLFVTIRAWESGWEADVVQRIPTWPVFALITLGSFLLSLRYLTQFIQNIINKP